MNTPARFEDLVHRVRAGDRTAADELVRQFEPELRRRVRLLLSDRQTWATCGLSDIVQSVFRRFLVKLLGGNYDLKDPGQLIGLLVAIGRNRITDHGRDPDNRVTRDSTLGMLTSVPDGEKTPSELITLRELLQRALEVMTDQERQILEQYVEGQSWHQIGRDHGMSADAARQKLNRARRRASRELGEDGLEYA